MARAASPLPFCRQAGELSSGNGIGDGAGDGVVVLLFTQPLANGNSAGG